jgi:hypothetical protein
LTAPFPFIVGYGRSGTTLLRAMVDAHPNVAIPDESHFVVPMLHHRGRYEHSRRFDLERFLEDLLAHHGFRGWKLPDDEVRAAFHEDPPASIPDAIREAYSLYAAWQGKARYGDKTPIHVLHLERLGDAFVEARFIHVIRDGRDVASSYLRQSFGPRTVAEAAVRWKRAIIRGQATGRRLGAGRYREVRYETLVQDPERVIRSVAEFLDLPYDPAMLRYHERGRVATERPHYRNVASPPTRDLRNWRQELTADDVTTFEMIAGSLLEVLGYERDPSPPELASRLRAGGRWIRVQVGRGSHKLRKAVGELAGDRPRTRLGAETPREGRVP